MQDEWFRDDRPLYGFERYGTGTLPNGDVLLVLEIQRVDDSRKRKRLLRLAMPRNGASVLSRELALLARVPHARPPKRRN
jgi:hypothetical protein